MPATNQCKQAAVETVDLLDYRFAFDGHLGEVMRSFAQADAANWKLSPKFRCYYRLRPWIPLLLRQILQKSRNRNLPVGDDWYCHQGFLAQFKAALTLDRSEVCSQIVHPWPDGFQHAILLTHDIESAAGLTRIDALARLEEQYGFRSAWYFVPKKYKIDPGLLADLRSRGHEVGVHGFNHDGRLFCSRRNFLRRAQHINAVAGQWQASGFRAPMMHRQLVWMQALQFDYDASCFDIDPFQAMPGGVGSVWPFLAGRLVELPCTLPQDHTLFVTLQQQSIDIWKRKYGLLQRLRGMAVCLVHPDYVDSPQRQDLYKELLEEFAAAADAWACLPREAAQWWRLRNASRIEDDAIVGPAHDRGRTVSLQSVFAELR